MENNYTEFRVIACHEMLADVGRLITYRQPKIIIKMPVASGFVELCIIRHLPFKRISSHHLRSLIISNNSWDNILFRPELFFPESIICGETWILDSDVSLFKMSFVDMIRNITPAGKFTIMKEVWKWYGP